MPRCGRQDHDLKTIVPLWVKKHSRFALLFEAFAIEVIQACRTVKPAASLLRLFWLVAQTIMDPAFERGFEWREATPISHVGIDVKSFGKGHDHITALADIDSTRVLDVAPERTQAATEGVLQTLTVWQPHEGCRRGRRHAPRLRKRGSQPDPERGTLAQQVRCYQAP